MPAHNPFKTALAERRPQVGLWLSMADPYLAEAAANFSQLRLRGIMSIPSPDPDMARRQRSFAALRTLFERLRAEHPQIDTLSMGMSEDFELAIREGATLVRVGSALFGPRAVAS